jgi:DNA-binding winged helix-turn-helix (wHTH) protein/Tol biopolymer transport system component
MNVQAHRLYQFGAFQIDARERVLLREGAPVPLPPKAFDVLLVLVERCGHIVEKDDLLKAAWPDAFVEEGNLPVNVSLLRKVLGDDRRNGNRFIETVPRRGYRFVAPVVEISPAVPISVNGDTTVTPHIGAGTPPGGGSNGTALRNAPPGFSPASGPNGDRTGQGYPEAAPRQTSTLESEAASVVARRTSRLAAVVAGGAVLAVVCCAWLLVRPLAAPTASRPTPLTNDGFVKGRLATDGERLYFTERVSTGEWVLEQISVDGGEAVPIPVPATYLPSVDVSPDHSTLVLSSDANPGAPIWLLPLPGVSVRQLGSVTGKDASWSSKGRSVTFCTRHEVWTANHDGTDLRKIITVPGDVSCPRWSPDGSRLAFTISTSTAIRSATSLWEISLAGEALHPILRTPLNDPPRETNGSWTMDGKYFLFDSTSDGKIDIWAIREKGRGFHWRAGAPLKLTDLPQSSQWPLPSPDGKRVFFLAHTEQGRLERFSRAENQFVPYLEGISAERVTFSPDKHWLAYVKYPDRSLWCMKRDGLDARQLAFSPMRVQGLAWSPDGKQIAFNAENGTNRYKNFLVAAMGGERPRELRPDHSEMEGIPSWSADGSKIAFGDVPEEFGHGSRGNVIHILNLQAGNSQPLPHSEGFWSPRWSPDGRYIAALKDDDPDPDRQALWLYDWKTERWRDLRVDHVGDVVWSHDSAYIYYNREAGYQGIFRVRIPDGSPEPVADTNKTRLAGDSWFGLTPDDSPMILSDAGIQEIYSVDVDWH